MKEKVNFNLPLYASKRCVVIDDFANHILCSLSSCSCRLSCCFLIWHLLAKPKEQRNRYHFESSICPRITATARTTWDTILPKMFLRSSCRSPLGRTVCQRLQQRQQQKEELHQLSRALTTATGPRKHVSKVMLEEVAGLRSGHFEM